MNHRIYASALALALPACGGGGDIGGSGSASASSTATTSAAASSTTGAGGSAGATSTTAATSSSAASGGGGGAPATCDGYEPCGVYPVAAPDGYTIASSPGITVFNQYMNTTCRDFADCDMWNTHFTPMWNASDNGYNRMGSPFPWQLSRYIVSTPPKVVTYAKFHMTAPGEKYVYSDGTAEMHTDPMTGATTCYQRGPGHLMQGMLENMGGTGDLGFVDWTISVLPGDMGNTGNVSTCQGTGATTWIVITSDEGTASMADQNGKYHDCLLREGQDYYLNFMSHGMPYQVDCAVDDCTMGGFQFANPVMSDGGELLTKVPCN